MNVRHQERAWCRDGARRRPPTLNTCGGWKRTFADSFEITTGTIGHDEESKKQTKVLNRCISVNDGVYTVEEDGRHSEMIVKELWRH